MPFWNYFVILDAVTISRELKMATGSQVYRSSEDKYVEDVYVTTKDLNFDVDIMSRRDIMTLGMRPINKFRGWIPIEL